MYLVAVRRTNIVDFLGGFVCQLVRKKTKQVIQGASKWWLGFPRGGSGGRACAWHPTTPHEALGAGICQGGSKQISHEICVDLPYESIRLEYNSVWIIPPEVVHVKPYSHSDLFRW